MNKLQVEKLNGVSNSYQKGFILAYFSCTSMKKRAYYECKNVEKALQRHIQDAIEDKYLESLIDDNTQLITEDVPIVLAYLFDTYGKVPSEEVKQKEE